MFCALLIFFLKKKIGKFVFLPRWRNSTLSRSSLLQLRAPGHDTTNKTLKKWTEQGRLPRNLRNNAAVGSVGFRSASHISQTELYRSLQSRTFNRHSQNKTKKPNKQPSKKSLIPIPKGKGGKCCLTTENLFGNTCLTPAKQTPMEKIAPPPLLPHSFNGA